MKTAVNKNVRPQNNCAKMRKADQPYEIWKFGDWEWRVLKKHQTDDYKPFARWFCAVKSPYTYGEFTLGDCYSAEIMSVATRTYKEETN